MKSSVILASLAVALLGVFGPVSAGEVSSTGVAQVVPIRYYCHHHRHHHRCHRWHHHRHYHP